MAGKLDERRSLVGRGRAAVEQPDGGLRREFRQQPDGYLEQLANGWRPFVQFLDQLHDRQRRRQPDAGQYAKQRQRRRRLIDATSASGSGANNLNSRLELYSNVTMQTGGKPLIVNGTMIGTGGLTIATGTVSLTSSSSYSGGTTIGSGQQAGVLLIQANQAFGTGGVSFDSQGNANAARLELAGGITLGNPITWPGRNNTGAAFENLSGNNTLSGTLSLASGGGTYAIQSDAGQLTLSAPTAITVGAGVTGTRTVSFLGTGNTLVSGGLANGNAGSLAVAANSPGGLFLPRPTATRAERRYPAARWSPTMCGARQRERDARRRGELNYAAATNAPLAVGGTLGIGYPLAGGGTSTVFGGSIGTSASSAAIRVTGVAAAAAGRGPCQCLRDKRIWPSQRLARTRCFTPPTAAASMPRPTRSISFITTAVSPSARPW